MANPLRIASAEEEEFQQPRPSSDAKQSLALSETIDVIARVIDAESGLKSLYTVALDGLKNALGIERASILFFDPDGVMRFKAWMGISDSYRTAVEGHTPWTAGAINPEPLVVSNVQHDPTLKPYLPLFAEEDIRALAFIPLLYRGRLLGKFMLYSRVPYEFKDELEFSLTLGKLVAFGVFRNKTEEELRASEELFRTTFELTSIGKILISATDGRILRVNRKFAELTGYTPEELKTKTFTDIIHPDDQRESLKDFQDLLSGKSPHTNDKRYIRKDGKPIWTSISLASIRGVSGKTVSIIAAIQDITDRKANEEQNQESLRKYQELVDSVDGIVWEVTPAFRFIFVSKQAERILGYPVEQWLNEPDFWVKRIHPEDRDSAIGYCKAQCSNLRDHDFDYRMIAADGRIVWLRDLVHIVVKDGRIAGLRGIMVDITTQKLTSEELQRSYSLLHATLESVADGILAVDLEGNIARFNTPFLKLWHIPAEILSSQKDTRALAFVLEQLKNPELFLTKVRELYAHPEEESHDPLEFKDGRTFERYSRPQRIGDKIVGRVWSFRDVTEQVRATAELKEMSEKLNKVMTSISDYLWSATIDQNGKFINRYYSSVVEKITGRAPDYYLVSPDRWINSIHPEDRMRIENSLQKIQTRQSNHEEVEYRITLPDGNIRWLRDSATATELPTGELRIDGVVSDITERKLNSETREHLLTQETHSRMEAERAVQLRDDFLSIAAHELRTPLTPIRMNLQLVKYHLETLASDLPKVEFLRKAVQLTEQEFERFLKLVENLLDVSRISAGRLTLEISEFDLSDLVKNVTERFDAELQKAGCELHLDTGRPAVGRWDQSRIEQVVVNLLSNAIKYGTHKPIEVSVTQRDDKAFIKIQDHGIGINEADQEKLFRRFERVAPIKHFGGFGLGLFISREIAEAHGGAIRLRSAPGSGSTFTVELPLHSNQTSALT